MGHSVAYMYGTKHRQGYIVLFPMHSHRATKTLSPTSPLLSAHNRKAWEKGACYGSQHMCLVHALRDETPVTGLKSKDRTNQVQCADHFHRKDVTY